MKFLATAKMPELIFTRTQRKCIVDEASDLIILYETIIKIEASLPSVWQGIKDKIETIATKYLVGVFSENLTRGGAV